MKNNLSGTDPQKSGTDNAANAAGNSGAAQLNLKLLEFRNQIQSKLDWLLSLRKCYHTSAFQMKRQLSNMSHIPQFAAQKLSDGQLSRSKLETLLSTTLGNHPFKKNGSAIGVPQTNSKQAAAAAPPATIDHSNVLPSAIKDKQYLSLAHLSRKDSGQY